MPFIAINFGFTQQANAISQGQSIKWNHVRWQGSTKDQAWFTQQPSQRNITLPLNLIPKFEHILS